MSERLITVCVPYAGKSIALLSEAIGAIERSLDGNGIVKIVADGRDAAQTLAGHEFGGDVEIARFDENAGLVGNWNRCLEAAQTPLVHIHHDDDFVRADFYPALLELYRKFPRAGVFALGRGTESSVPGPESRQSVSCLIGLDAATLLMTSGETCCGAIVINADRHGAVRFESRYAYCPDESTYPRMASDGGVAFDPRALYVERDHEGQSRFSTWKREDFIPVYFAARDDGARHFGGEARKQVSQATFRRAVSAAVAIGLDGLPLESRRMLRQIAVEHPRAYLSIAYLGARVSTRSRFLRQRVAARRRRLGRR